MKCIRVHVVLQNTADVQHLSDSASIGNKTRSCCHYTNICIHRNKPQKGKTRNRDTERITKANQYQ